MPRLIFKCPYIKGGEKNASHLDNYVRYISTREGVDKNIREDGSLPATEGQQEMIQRIIKDFPLSRGMFEYSDYMDAPTRTNASEFISRALEDNYDSIGKRENYVQYIAQRPHAQRVGSHGLFSGTDDSITLTRTAREVAHHTGNVWLPIFSLRREDAERLGYDNAEAWKTFLTAHIPQMAEAMKIPLESFRWYAAFHDEGHHPHVHMVCYSTDPRKGYLTRDGIQKIRSLLAGDIFRNELTQIYEQQTERRNELRDIAKERLEETISQIQKGTLRDPHVGDLIEQLSEKLSHLSGRKQYGYLKKPLKALVDEIVDEIEKDPKVQEAYSLWYELREEVLRTYKDDMPDRVPLSRQPEFKSIKNIIIEEAVRLGNLSSVFCDDPDPTEADELPDAFSAEYTYRPTDDERRIWKQAEEYNNCKKLIYDGDTPPEDKLAALSKLEKLYDSGFVVAAHLLGKIYRDGVFINTDVSAAEWWFSKSAAVGNDYSQYALGKLLEGQQRFEEAVVWLTKAADQNNRYAQYRLAKLLLKGDDVPKDVAQAVLLLTASARQGNQYAQYALGKLYLEGKDIARDSTAAVLWLTMSADQGNEYAQYLLRHMYDWRSAAISQSVGRLLHHLGNLFREQQNKDSANAQQIVERKVRRKIQEKKRALGIKSEGQTQRY